MTIHEAQRQGAQHAALGVQRRHARHRAAEVGHVAAGRRLPPRHVGRRLLAARRGRAGEEGRHRAQLGEAGVCV